MLERAKFLPGWLYRGQHEILSGCRIPFLDGLSYDVIGNKGGAEERGSSEGRQQLLGRTGMKVLKCHVSAFKLKTTPRSE